LDRTGADWQDRKGWEWTGAERDGTDWQEGKGMYGSRLEGKRLAGQEWVEWTGNDWQDWMVPEACGDDRNGMAGKERI
jgi:hypothetical protein